MQPLPDEPTLLSQFDSTIEIMSIQCTSPPPVPKYIHQVVEDVILHFIAVDLDNIPVPGDDTNNIPGIIQTQIVVENVGLDDDDSVTIDQQLLISTIWNPQMLFCNLILYLTRNIFIWL